MAKKKVYQEKTNPVLNVLYFIVVLALVAALGWMYRNWQGRQAEYKELVRQAAESEITMDIEDRKVTEDRR